MAKRGKGTLPNLENASSLALIYENLPNIKLQTNGELDFNKELDNLLKKDSVKTNILEILKLFDLFVSGFKTYKHFLQTIKEVFARTLSQLQQEITELKLDQTTWRLLAEEKEKKLKEQEQQHDIDLDAMKREIVRLKKANEEMKLLTSSHKKQICKLSRELTTIYGSFVEEKQSRKLLVNEVAKLRRADVTSEFNVKFNRGEKEGQKFKSSDDPVLLRIALKKARESGDEATRRFEELKLSFEDAVDKKEFNQLLREKMAIEKKLQQIEDEMIFLKDKQIEGRIKEVSDEWEESKGVNKPLTNNIPGSDLIKSEESVLVSDENLEGVGGPEDAPVDCV